MPGGGHYRSEWDNYAKSWERQLFQDESSKLVWPGDEWGTEQSWRCIFEMMFLDLGAAGWKNCVEIGAGSGKYTQLLLDHSESDIVVFDISPAYLEVLKVRLASFIESGRVDPVILKADDSSEILNHLEKRGLIGKIDAFYSIDAMVHVDLQYLIVYLMSAALCLKEGGCLMMTLANAVSELGFKELIEDAKNRYETQDLPGSKFEWVSPEIAQGVLERLGFSVRFLLPFESLEEERDLHLVATLVDPSRAMRFREWL